MEVFSMKFLETIGHALWDKIIRSEMFSVNAGE